MQVKRMVFDRSKQSLALMFGVQTLYQEMKTAYKVITPLCLVCGSSNQK
jgi:hypothetical protein